MTDETRDEADTPSEPPARRQAALRIGVLVIGLVAGGVGGWAVIGPRAFAAPAAAPADSIAATASHRPPGKHGRSETSVHVVENLVVNPAGSQGTRFLIISLALELDSPGTAARLGERDAQLRDALIAALGARTVAELSDVVLRDALKAEVVQALQPLIPGGRVRAVFMPQFVIQ